MIQIADWHFLKAHGIPPTAGGRLDQDPVFLDAAQIIDDDQAREAASATQRADSKQLRIAK